MAGDLRASLKGKIVLVTGASSGIGRELALSLAKNGCYVVAAARRLKNLESLRDEIEAWSSTPASWGSGGAGEVAIVSLDVSADEAAIDTAVETCWNAFGHIDVLINNAGIRGGYLADSVLKQSIQCESCFIFGFD
jgi:NAD(P)-dependent dehydrogenase (short-subunit alcohol dehydrogenase family)